MHINIRQTIRLVGFIALIGADCSSDSCIADDPKIFPVKISQVDVSSEIDPEPQGGGKLLPLRKLNYERMKSTISKGFGQALLADGADPNVTSSDGEPILFYVLSFRNLTVLEDFLKAGADPNRKARDGSNLLHKAIWSSDAETVKLLLQYGADPNAESFGQTAIELARSNRKELAEILTANSLPRLKPRPIQPPQFLRQPDIVFGSTLFRPAMGGEAVIYSNDSQQVISGGDDGAIRFFDASTGEIQNVIAAHDGVISELAKIIGSDILISSGNSETKFWDAKTSRELMRLRGSGRGLSVSPNGRWIFTGVHLWEIESIKPLRLSALGRGYGQAGNGALISWSFFTPDNRYWIFGVQNGYVYVWDLNNDSGRRIGDLKTSEMQSLTWGDLKGMVDIGDASPDDLLALATNQYTVLTSSAKTLKAFQPTLANLVSGARSIACSPDGRFLAAIGFTSRIDTFDQAQGGQQLRLEGHTDGLQAVAVSPDGELIASGGSDKTVRLWDRKSSKQIAQIQAASYVYSICFSPLGRQLAIGDNDGGVYVHDLGTRELKKCRGRGRITGLRYDSKGEVLIALGSDLTVFDAASGETLTATSPGRSSICSLAMTPDNLVIGSTNGSAATETFCVPNAWILKEKRLAAIPNLFSEAMGHRSNICAVATSSDGSMLASVSDFTIRLWDLKKREPIGGKMVGHTSYVQDMQFSPNGKLLASGGGDRDGTTRIWEIPSGRLLMVLDADVNRVSSIAFLPDGSLITANWNGTVHLWDLPKQLDDGEVKRAFAP